MGPLIAAVALGVAAMAGPPVPAGETASRDQPLQDVPAPALTPEKVAAIRELIDVTRARVNSAAFASAFSQQMLVALRAGNPGLSDRAIAIVQQEVNQVVEEEMQQESLQALIYPVYARHFTLDELKALIAFNRSPAGIKANEVMPLLLEESRQAAEAWSREIGPRIGERVLERFREEGIDVIVPPDKD